MLRLALIFFLINSWTILFSQEADESEAFLNDLFGTAMSVAPQNISSYDHSEILRALKKNVFPENRLIIARKSDPLTVPARTTITLTDAELDSIRRAFRTPAGYSWVKDQNFSYVFAGPVFLRENSICFFYYEVNCGNLCGEGKFAIYRKVNGKWQHYSTIWEWIS